MSPRVSIRLLATQSDERLVALARDGHERAFEALVRRYRRPLLRYCQRLRLSDARAEDVVQQALTKAWLALARGAEVREPRAWLYRIAHNAAVNTIRASREVPTEPDGVLRDSPPTDESELDRTLAVRDALGHVAALPAMQRDAVFLTAVDGQSHDEVASSLGISQGAVRGLLYRARTTLRSATAAVTPAPLIEWASRGAETAAPSAERIAELTAGAGAAGFAGLVVKGVAVAVSVGALATGVAVKLHHPGPARAHRAVPRLSADVAHGAIAPSGETASAIGVGSSAVSAVPVGAPHGRHGQARRGSRVARSFALARGEGGRHGVADTQSLALGPRRAERVRRSGRGAGGDAQHGGTRSAASREAHERSGDGGAQTGSGDRSGDGDRESGSGGDGEHTQTAATPSPSGAGEAEPNGGEPLGSQRERAQTSSTSSDDTHVRGGEPMQTGGEPPAEGSGKDN